jgi:hypothetical protein
MEFYLALKERNTVTGDNMGESDILRYSIAWMNLENIMSLLKPNKRSLNV